MTVQACHPDERAGLQRALRELRAARDESPVHDYRWELYLEACARISTLLGEDPAAEPAGVPFPAALTPELTEVLGMPNFQCSPIAHAFVAAGEAKIAPKAEAEQAFVLHWLTTLVLKHGNGWRAAAGQRLDDVVKRARAAAAADQTRST